MNWFDFFILTCLFVEILTLYILINLLIVIFQIFFSIPYYKNFRDNNKARGLFKESVIFFREELEIDNDVIVDLRLYFPSTTSFYHGVVRQHLEKEKNYRVDIMMNHNKYQILSTIAHEMVHVKQMSAGDLKIDNKKARKYWKGMDHSHTRYSDQPWEIEAFKQEKALAVKFMKHKKMKYGPLLLTIRNLFGSI